MDKIPRFFHKKAAALAAFFIVPLALVALSQPTLASTDDPVPLALEKNLGSDAGEIAIAIKTDPGKTAAPIGMQHEFLTDDGTLDAKTPALSSLLGGEAAAIDKVTSPTRCHPCTDADFDMAPDPSSTMIPDEVAKKKAIGEFGSYYVKATDLGKTAG